jgi:hypothetical protein
MTEVIMKMLRSVAVIVAACAIASWIAARAAAAEETGTVDREQAIRGSFGTYDSAPRGKDGHVDISRLLSELVDIRANTYHWLIAHASTDWEDLHRFLPLARERHVRVWVCLLPPSESAPHGRQYSEPFRLDYERWAIELAKLSAREPNLVAWSIDDYTHNLNSFTPERMRKILAPTREISPALAFVPCTYFPKVTPQFAENYRGLVDGLLFPYRHESNKPNLTDASLVEEEVKKIKAIVGPSLPVIVDVYATAHSRLGSSTPEYVRAVMVTGKKYADGVHVYCHQNPKSEKYRVIKELFRSWSASTLSHEK